MNWMNIKDKEINMWTKIFEKFKIYIETKNKRCLKREKRKMKR